MTKHTRFRDAIHAEALRLQSAGDEVDRRREGDGLLLIEDELVREVLWDTSRRLLDILEGE